MIGKRFYNANGDLVQRHFREYLSGTLSNPSTGKVLQWNQHDTVIHNLAVPGDVTTGSIQMTGAAIRVYRADGGTVLADAGRVLVDAASDTIVTSNGPHRFDDYFVRGNPDVLAPVCAALGLTLGSGARRLGILESSRWRCQAVRLRGLLARPPRS